MRELRALEPDFWRAPSLHSTRPWTLTYTSDEVSVGWDPARALPISDPTGRDLRLSMGAFVECCLIVCADADLAVAFRPDPGPSRVGFLYEGARPYETPFTTADVRARGADHGEYHGGRLTDEVAGAMEGMHRLPCRDLADLLQAADLLHTTDPPHPENLSRGASLPHEANPPHGVDPPHQTDPSHGVDLHRFGDRRVMRELRLWLRLTRRHRRSFLDGLSERPLGLTKLAALRLRASLALFPALRRLSLPRALAGASRELLDYEGDVLVLVGAVSEEVAAGRALMRNWLRLSRLGYTTHPLTQIIDYEPTRRALADRLGVANPRTLLHVARVSRPKGPAEVPAGTPR